MLKSIVKIIFVPQTNLCNHVAMDYEKAIKYFGNGNVLARKLNLTRQAVYVWKRRGIPTNMQFRLQVMSKGKLRAAIPHEQADLRRVSK